jgi:serine/threonine-protein kinase
VEGLLIPLAAIVCTIGLPIWVWYRLRSRRLELEAAARGLAAPGADKKELHALQAENQRLRERIENLETVVLNVDFEINQRILRVAEQHSQIMALGAASAPANPGNDASFAASETQGAKSGALFAALAAAPAMPLPLQRDSVVAGRYRIEAEVGRGGMGIVYRAYDNELGETVALKIIAPHLSNDSLVAERFRREVGAARRVTHPNVVRIHDLGQADGQLFYSMEWFAGTSLEQRLTTVRALSLNEMARVLLPACDGLDAAHRAGVIHRDLKPGNILVSDDAVKIIDFGLASAAGSAGLTATGLLVGTPAYMAPEQVRGGVQDERTDLYAFGVVLYRCAVGELPFTAANPIAVGFAHVSEAPRPPRERRPDLPESLERVILRALEKDPRARFPRIRDLKTALEATLR